MAKRQASTTFNGWVATYIGQTVQASSASQKRDGGIKGRTSRDVNGALLQVISVSIVVMGGIKGLSEK